MRVVYCSKYVMLKLNVKWQIFKYEQPTVAQTCTAAAQSIEHNTSLSCLAVNVHQTRHTDVRKESGIR